jgi:hypothetical protein
VIAGVCCLAMTSLFSLVLVDQAAVLAVDRLASMVEQEDSAESVLSVAQPSSLSLWALAVQDSSKACHVSSCLAS